MTQFREPWHVHDTPERCWIHDSAEHYVCGTKDSVERPPERAMLAERIVACINFCRNLPTEMLQFYGAPLPDEKPGRVPAEDLAQTVAHD